MTRTAAEEGAPTGPRSELVARLARQIAQDLRAQGAGPGTPVRAQALADRHRVSRFPVTEALRLLAGEGALVHEPNRGFFVAPGLAQRPPDPRPAEDELTGVYFRLAEERLSGALPEQVTQTFLRERYGLTQGQLQQLVARVAGEGWIERRPGYGLVFSPILTTPEALDQTYRFRAALEPASLLEPGYRLDPLLAARCRRTEEELLAGGLDRMSTGELYDRGVFFHETIVGASHNPFFVDALQRINRVRRLLAYRSSQDRRRYLQQATEHLEILDLLERGENAVAAACLTVHLSHVIKNLDAIRPLLRTALIRADAAGDGPAPPDPT